jgi:methyl-accepting chemotaxis protein
MNLNLRNFPIGTRLIATTIGALGLMVVFVLIGWLKLNSVSSSLNHLVDNNLRKTEVTHEMRQHSQQIGENLRNAFLYEEAGRSEESLKKIQAALAGYMKGEQTLDATLVTERGRRVYAEIVAQRKPAEASVKRVLEMQRQGLHSEAKTLFLNETAPALQKWQGAMDTSLALQRDNTARDVAEAEEHRQAAIITMISLIVLAVLVMIPSGLWVTRQITGPLHRAIDVANAVATGRLDNQIDASGKDEPAQLLSQLEKMQRQLRTSLTEERRVATDALRIKTALDSGSNCVMVADTEGQIIYCNAAVLNMLSNAESDIRKGLPSFRADAVLGSNFDTFHRNPAHQRNLLGQLRSVHQAQIEIGGRHFLLVAAPIFGTGNERLGTVVEWRDRTLEVSMENEVSSIINAAAAGDFSRRIDTSRMAGFFAQLGRDINALLEASNSALANVGQVLGQLSHGDLTQKITSDYQGVLGKLKDDTNATVDQLQEIIASIKEATDAINTAAQEIASGNQDLSARTEEQASSLEETASSMEQLTSTVKQNAENANNANRLASEAQQVAEKAGAVVGQVVETMSAIHQSSSKIADIIGVIDGIAFQTNILALNAAVEAARAGEQGRGFAVVASEVRNLAQRSAGAAKEIKTLISDSVEKVEVGGRLVDTAGQTMDEVVSSIKRVAQIMTDIAEASREQSSGIEQVGLAIGQMDEMTQQNAALVEQAAAAAESLEEQARNLASAVAVFRLAGGIHASSPRVLTVSYQRQPSGKESVPRLTRKAASLPPPSRSTTGLEDEWEEF